MIPKRLITANPDRLNYIRFAFSEGLSVEEIWEMTKIDPWFLEQVKTVVDEQSELATANLETVTEHQLRRAKRYGLSDNRLGRLFGATETAIRNRRQGVGPFARCSSESTHVRREFESFTPYL